MPAALFFRREDERRARSAWGAAGVAGRSLSCLLDQLDRAAGSSGLEFRRGRLQVVPQSALQWEFVACVWTIWCLWIPWDCLVTNIEIVLQGTRTILSAVEGRTRQQATSAPSRSAVQKHLAADSLAPSQGLTKQLSAAVALSRFCFGDRTRRLFCVCELRTEGYNVHSANFAFVGTVLS